MQRVRAEAANALHFQAPPLNSKVEGFLADGLLVSGRNFRRLRPVCCSASFFRWCAGHFPGTPGMFVLHRSSKIS
jgi:hypothetical protein